ncbi:DDE-type integrase/transposase/recombinase [Streptomyces sp. SID7909]|nr:DDE-type integrase/transposase/recombinase [Streptomyces sp. SID7909]
MRRSTTSGSPGSCGRPGSKGPVAPAAPHDRPRSGCGPGAGPGRPGLHRPGGITYLPLEGGKFCYPATVIDLASRRLAGWAIAEHMRVDLVTDALAAAVRTRGSLAGSIMHTDQLVQYISRITRVQDSR